MTKASLGSIGNGISNSNNNANHSSAHTQTSTYSVRSSNGLLIGSVREQQQVKPCVVTKFRVPIQEPPFWKIHAVAKHLQKKKLSQVPSSSVAAMSTDSNMDNNNDMDAELVAIEENKHKNDNNNDNYNDNNNDNSKNNNHIEINEMKIEYSKHNVSSSTSSSSSSGQKTIREELTAEPKPSTSATIHTAADSADKMEADESNESEGQSNQTRSSSPVVSTEQVRRELDNLNVKSLIVKKEIDSLNVVRSNLLWLLKKTVLSETIRNHNRDK